MSKNFKEMFEGLSVAELKEARVVALELTKVVKAQEKVEGAKIADATVDHVNALINKNALGFGTEIIVMYNGSAVEAVVENAPTEKSKNLNLKSDAFKCANNTRYTAKSAFVSLVDGSNSVPADAVEADEDYADDGEEIDLN